MSPTDQAETAQSVAFSATAHVQTTLLEILAKMLDEDLADIQAGDDWDEDVGEDEDPFDDHDEDLDDPVFKGLEARAVSEAVMSPQTAELLGRYEGERLAVMRETPKLSHSSASDGRRSPSPWAPERIRSRRITAT